jgi:type IV secretion system protein VirB8
VAQDLAAEEYFAAARSWEEDRVASAERRARHACWAALLAGLMCAAAIIALACIAPLKTVEPYVIRVDSSSGVVDIVPQLRGTAAPGELVTRHLLQMYIVARERYVAALAENDYATVGAMQTAPLNQAWLAAWDPNRPESPLNRYRDGTTVRAQVQAVTFLPRASGASDLAQVRFLTGTRVAGTGNERLAHWIATITYAYGPASHDDRQRLLNPLGLRVTEYRREPEVPPPDVPP